MVEFFFEKIYYRSTTQRRVAAKPLPWSPLTPVARTPLRHTASPSQQSLQKAKKLRHSADTLQTPSLVWTRIDQQSLLYIYSCIKLPIV